MISSAEIFAAALLPQTSTPTPNASISSNASLSEINGTNFSAIQPHEQKPRLIIRKDLLDDSNAAKDLMDDVKKRLKILLRPGEPDKRPDLTWPKSLKKEPVEVVREVIQLLSSFRDIMRRNFNTMDVDKIQPRWCGIYRLGARYSLIFFQGAVAMSLGYLLNDGKNFLKISVMSSKRSSIHHGHVFRHSLCRPVTKCISSGLGAI